MKQNLGKFDRVLRFVLAFWWLGSWAPVYNVALINWLIAIVAWIALAESFIGWCPLHQILRIGKTD
jgi:hypothetical protein